MSSVNPRPWISSRLLLTNAKFKTLQTNFAYLGTQKNDQNSVTYFVQDVHCYVVQLLKLKQTFRRLVLQDPKYCIKQVPFELQTAISGLMNVSNMQIFVLFF